MEGLEKLKKMVDNVKDHPELLSSIIDIMKGDSVQKIINRVLTTRKIDEEDVYDIKTIIDCAQTIYNYSGSETGMSDSEYDIIYELLENYGDVSITVPVVSTGKTGFHRFKSLRGTLDKVYALTDDDIVENKSRRTLDDWIKSSETKIKSTSGLSVNLNEEEVYVFPKFDGVSAIFEFTSEGKLSRVLTRGFTETNEAQDITHCFSWIGDDWVKGIQKTGNPYGLKTEIMMSDEDFNKYNSIYKTDYKQSRSIVSSILNSDEIDDRVKYLQIMQLRYSYLIDGEESLQKLAPGAFNVPFLKCKLKEREAIRKFASEHKYANGLRCDGAVIYLINEQLQNILGRENDKQKFEVAYKFTEESTYSKIKDIKFTAGLFGRINPVAVIKPVKLKGNTIENVSLGSMGRFKDLQLAKGDKVKILYDIIPYLVYDDNDEHCKRSGEKPIEIPWCCPECGEPLEFSDSGDICFCNNKECPCKKKGKILNFFNRMNIDGISYATVDTFYNHGYLENIEDIYKLKDYRKQLCKLDGFGKKSIDLILNEIEEHKDVSASQMLGSIGIENVSVKTFEKVFQMISFNELIDLVLDSEDKAKSVLTLIPGIKDKTAEKIISGIKENKKLIEFLEDELIILKESKPKDFKYSVVFTKIRDEDLEKWITEHEGSVKDSLTKDTSILVVPAIGVESSKVTKAEKYGIPVVAISDLKEYIINNFIEVPF